MPSASSPADAVGPRALNTARLTWADVPAHVNARIEDKVGSAIVGAHQAIEGFSPGFSGTVCFQDSQEIFIKVVSADRDPGSAALARLELAANAEIPPSVSAPALLWSSMEDWCVLAFERVPGHCPPLPWRRSELDTVLAAVTHLSEITPAQGHGLAGIADSDEAFFRSWAAYAAHSGPERDTRIGRLGELGPWVERHLDSLLAWEADGPAAAAGDRLMHGDLRGDNMLIDGDRVWLVDWPYAAVGAPWLDLVTLLPSVQMQGGPRAADVFAAHPLSRMVDDDRLRAWLTVITGHFLLNSIEPAPATIPTLRAFQHGQALACVEWLREAETVLQRT